MPKQLNIRSDEAHRLAHLIADQTGRYVVDVVVEALREYGSKLPPVDDMTPTQRAGYEALRKLAKGGQVQTPGRDLRSFLLV